MVIYSRIFAEDWGAGGDDAEAARCVKFPPRSRFEEPDPKVREPFFHDAVEVLPICNGDYVGSPCPRRSACLQISLVNNDGFGVWGGMTTPQRRWIRRNVDKEHWTDDTYLRDTVPEPGYFKDLGDTDDDDDEEMVEFEEE